MPRSPAIRPGPAHMIRLFLALLLPGLLAACANQPDGPVMPVTEEQEDYQAHAHSHYTSPGPANDPWGPYINEAASRFDVPAQWIRAVMNQESGGHLYDNVGHFITSTPGAMGLMQIMPPAYDDLRARYNLGPDPYDPRDNILAGTAYIRQMYESYGSPGFLAAYNYGPGSLDHYLRQNRALPRETRNYVAAIAPKIVGIWPRQRSRNDLIVARHDRTSRLSPRNEAAMAPAQPVTPQQAVQTAENQDIRTAWATHGLSTPPVQDPPPPASARTKTAPAPQEIDGPDDGSSSGDLHIRSIPLADTPADRGSATDMLSESTYDWAIQLGSYGGQNQAQMVAIELRPRITALARNATVAVVKIQTTRETVYRARLTNMTHGQAINACKRLKGTITCMTVPPGSRF